LIVALGIAIAAWTQPDSSLFVDIADAIGLGNPAIVE
jgi:hypothetical protein